MNRGGLLFSVLLVVSTVISANAIAQARVTAADVEANYLPVANADSLPVLEARTERAVPQNEAQLRYSFAALVRTTAPAVVNVYAEKMVRQRTPFAGDPFFERFFGQQMPGRTRKQSSLGSGVVVDPSGLVVTNNHVIDGADEIKVAFADGRELPCRVLLKDERVDLAVLKIEGEGGFASIGYSDSDRLEVGDIVLAIGNPFGVGQTVTSGIVSALARNGIGISDFGFFIQTDAAINPGNSGGALVDMDGNLVGVNTAIYSRSGGSNGIGFAIPANMVRAVVEAAKRGDDRFRQPYVGATFSPVTSDMAEALGMEVARGAIVTDIVRAGPADRAGLKVGDIVLTLDGLIVQHPDALGYRLATAGIGNSVELLVLSRSRTRTVSIGLESPRERGKGGEIRLTGNNPFSGALVADLEPRLAEELDLPYSAEGVVVLDVERGSLAGRFGLRERDIVTEVNGVTITDIRRLEDVVRRDAGFWKFEVDRNGRRLRQFVR